MRKVRNHGRVRFLVDGRDPLTGARKRLFFATAGKAKAKERELAAEPAEPLHPLCDPEVSLARYGETWLTAHANGWEPRTLRSYTDTFRLHLVPFALGGGVTLGNVRMRDLHRGHLKALVVAKRKAGYAPDSVRLMAVTFRAICDAAVGDRLLRAHPVDAALRRELRGLLRPLASEPKPFTAEQMQRFLKLASESSTLHPLYVTGFVAGLRLGELTGLHLGDLTGRKLQVARQLGQEAKMLDPVPSLPKGKKVRMVDAPTTLAALFDRLRTQRKRLTLACGWQSVPPWAFITGNGTPISQRFVEADFKRLLGVLHAADKKAGKGEGERFPLHLTPHSMRHTFACLHIARGCNPKWLQQQMGHSSISVTLDRYAKWWNLEDHAAADALGALIGSEMAAEAP